MIKKGEVVLLALGGNDLDLFTNKEEELHSEIADNVVEDLRQFIT